MSACIRLLVGHVGPADRFRRQNLVPIDHEHDRPRKFLAIDKGLNLFGELCGRRGLETGKTGAGRARRKRINVKEEVFLGMVIFTNLCGCLFGG